MDEDIEAEIGRCFPERAQALRIELLTLKLGGNDDARKAEFHRAAAKLRRRCERVECRHMCKSYEAAGVVAFHLPHPVVDQAAYRNVRLIETGTARQNRHVEAGTVHHSHMGGKISEQRVEAVIGIAVFVQTQSAARAVLHQLGRRVVMLEIDDHAVVQCAAIDRTEGWPMSLWLSP